MSLSTKSCKAKGRRLQNEVAKDVLRLMQMIDPTLDGSDVKGAVMGTSGEDIVLSSRARACLDFCIECKNVEALNVSRTFITHIEKYHAKPSLKLLVHSRNRTMPLVTLTWKDFLLLYSLMLTLISTKIGPDSNASA